VVKNGYIATCLHCVSRYLTEDMLYDFILEARMDKCRAFRNWVTGTVFPSIRGYKM